MSRQKSFNFAAKEQRQRIAKKRQALGYTLKLKSKLIRKWASGRILELGCGEFPEFEDSVKVDIAKIKMKNYIRADLNLPLQIKEKFDTIITLEIIEHVHNINIFLNECNRLLKSGGKLIVSTPNVKYWMNRLWLLFGNDRWFDTGGMDYFFFSPDSLKKLLEKHGFVVEEMKSVGRVKIINICGGFIVLARKK
jgi:SAM-dependent methyltransferase